jgi:serine/threonine protein kinase
MNAEHTSGRPIENAKSNGAPNTQHPPLAIGDRIEGRWEIYHTFKGGMGIVYIVYDHEHQMPYAVKTFRNDKHSDNSHTAAGFMREALTWINLDAHENVTRAEFVQTITGQPFLFLEYVNGGDLSGWIGTPRLTENLPQVLRFAIQFCDGMIHAGAKGIDVHRDIKPRNCLITEDGTLKITDFGLAKAFHHTKAAHVNVQSGNTGARDDESETGTSRGAGTCTHMAPEQFEDVDQVDIRADIYSFGVLVFQMITGSLPFDGDTWEELKEQHRNREPRSLPEAVPPRLRALVGSCLKKNPAERFPDFGALRRELAAIYEKIAGVNAPEQMFGAKLDAVEWSNKGVSLSQLGRYEEALSCYERALDLNADFKEVWNNQGLALRELQRYPDALDSFDRALALDPSFAVAWNNKGHTLECLGRRFEALSCYGHAVAAGPNMLSGKLARWAARALQSWSGEGKIGRL